MVPNTALNSLTAERSSSNLAIVPCWMHDLPEEVLCNIFRRLPMATLATVLCHVCRSWRRLIEFPSFSRNHPSSSPGGLIQVWADGGDSIGKMIAKRGGERKYTRRGGESRRYHCAFIPNKHPRYHVLCHKFFSLNYLRAVHSCGGLVLLARNHVPAVVCNPLLRRWARLPQDPFEDRVEVPSYYGNDICAGIGFDSSNGVFKVFNLVSTHGCQDVAARVCTLSGANSDEWEWRTPAGEDPKYEAQKSGGCALVEGKLHWVSTNSDYLVVADVQTESFSALALPMLWSHRCYVSVAAADEKLCVRLRDGRDWRERKPKDSEIWVMGEYGEPGSWAMIATTEKGRSFSNDFWWLMPRWGDDLDLYGLHNRKYVHPSCKKVSRPMAVPYIPTLVWPETNRGQRKWLCQERIQDFSLRKKSKLYEFNRMWPPLRCSCGSFLALLKREKKYPFQAYYVCERPNCNNFMWADRRQEHTPNTLAGENAALKYENIILRKENDYLMRRLRSAKFTLKHVSDLMAEDYQVDTRVLCSLDRQSSKDYKDSLDVPSKISRVRYQEERTWGSGCESSGGECEY